jgi:hypothetical protein
MILSAKESDGLAQWLNETGYKMPKGTEPTIVPLIDLIFKGQKYFWSKELLFNKFNKQLN